MTVAEFADWVQAGALSMNADPPQEQKVFQTGVGVLDLGKMASPPPLISMVPGKYCATPECAQKLASLLADLHPMIVPGWPEVFSMSGPFAFNRRVPCLQFPNGLQENAGVLADFFSHGGYNVDMLMRLVRWNIAADGFFYGFSTDDPGAFQG